MRGPDAIAVLGWGSLIWAPRGLPLAPGEWTRGGPRLPIEFCRISTDGRLTLVVDERHGAPVETLHRRSARTRLDRAVEDLARREVAAEKHIGWVDLSEGRSSARAFPEQLSVHDRVAAWCRRAGYRAAVWTALPETFEARRGAAFSPARGVKYLSGLAGAARKRALEYVVRAPPTTRTPLRELAGMRLGLGGGNGGPRRGPARPRAEPEEGRW